MNSEYISDKQQSILIAPQVFELKTPEECWHRANNAEQLA